MPVSEICNREVVIARCDTSVNEAAKLMRQYHVGDVVVVDEKNGQRIPLGIVTDRDLVVEIMAPGAEQMVVTVGEIMAPQLATVKQDTGVYEAMQYMRGKGVRRMPVVDGKGALVGILTLDDLLALLAEELLALSKLVKNEQKKEAGNRR